MKKIGCLFVIKIVLLFISIETKAQVVEQRGLIVYEQELEEGEALDKQGFLLFSPTESMYYFQRGKSSMPSTVEMEAAYFTFTFKDKEGITYYQNFSEKKLISRLYFPFDDNFLLLEEPLPELDWQIKDETVILGNFLCQKAICSFRGRKYIAYFSRQIPFPVGPWKFGGLPGAILELYDEDKLYIYRATTVEFPAELITKIAPPTKGKKIDGWKNYQTYVIERAIKWKQRMESKGPGYSVELDFTNGIEKFDINEKQDN